MEAAAAVGITRQTLQAWISKGQISAPKMQIRGKTAVRLWTARDVARLKQVKAKIYLRERGRPKRSGK